MPNTLHFHDSHKTNHFCSIAAFSHDAEHNTYSQPRHTRENRSGMALATNISLSASLSLLYKTEAKQNFVWLTTWRHFHNILTAFSRYSVCIISVICVKSCDLRSVITIFSRLMIFSPYFHDSRYFQDVIRIFSRHVHHDWKSSFASFQSCASTVVSRENIMKISWKYCETILKISSSRGTLKTFENTRSK